MPPINYLAVLVAGVVIFMLGGLWYSPVLFAKPWIALQGRTMEEMQASSGGKMMPIMYLQALLCGLLISFAMAILIGRIPVVHVMGGVKLAILCWVGFAAVTSYATYLFSMKSKSLWLIDSGYNLVSFVLAAVILAAWR